MGCRQLIRLKLALDLRPSAENHEVHNVSVSLNDCSTYFQVLPQVLEIPEELRKYYMKFVPSEKIIKNVNIYSIINAFNLPSEVGDQLLSAGSPSREPFPSGVIRLHLKDDNDYKTTFDLGKCASYNTNHIYSSEITGCTLFMVSVFVTSINNTVNFTTLTQPQF